MNKKFNHIMADIESLGVKSGYKILSIGAVYFNEEGLGEEFYTIISRKDQDRYKFKEDPDTLKWWDKQTSEARRVLGISSGEDPDISPVSTLDALTDFGEFCKLSKGSKLWGNGATFDNSIIQYHYRVLGMEHTWSRWGDRCFRTIKNTFLDITLPREGVHHHALDDAKSQANHLIKICKEKGLKLG